MAISSISGGTADKLGNIYEAYWGVFGMLEVLDGRANEIRIETPGIDGAEFSLQRAGHLEFWQTKRQVAGSQKWSIGRLSKEGILEFFHQNSEDGNRSVFASGSPPPELLELTQHATIDQDIEQFKEFFLKAGRDKAYEELTRNAHS
ncbi:MAG: hypothetical protein ACSHYA_19200 [Opitutaceae bacterium]